MMKERKSQYKVDCQQRLEEDIFSIHCFLVTNFIWSKEDLMTKFKIEKNRLDRILIIVKSRNSLNLKKVSRINNQNYYQVVK